MKEDCEVQVKQETWLGCVHDEMAMDGDDDGDCEMEI